MSLCYESSSGILDTEGFICDLNPIATPHVDVKAKNLLSPDKKWEKEVSRSVHAVSGNKQHVDLAYLD
jgi:hypothetical protein